MYSVTQYRVLNKAFFTFKMTQSFMVLADMQFYSNQQGRYRGNFADLKKPTNV
jgi:hypothetical protein